MEVLEEKNDRQTKSNLRQLQVFKDKTFVRAKIILEIIKKSERVTINRDNEVVYVDKVPRGPKAAIFLYDIQQSTKKLNNPSFIIYVIVLNLTENLIINRNDKHAVQSASINDQGKQEPGPSRTRSTSPTWQEKSSANLERRKNTNEKISAVIEKTEIKNVKKSQKKTLTCTECQ